MSKKSTPKAAGEGYLDRLVTCEVCYPAAYAADLKKAQEHAKTCKTCTPDKFCPVGLKFMESSKYDIAYMRVANMKAKGDGRESTEWHQVVSVCKHCRPKFEKSEHFVSWMELPK